jgi:acetyltransferase-like isoleucine patch superfamily enzyme
LANPLIQIPENVMLGEGALLHPPVVLGLSPDGSRAGADPLVIGAHAVIGPFTMIFAGTKIGKRLRAGQGVSVHEENDLGDDVIIGPHAVLEPGNRIGSRVKVGSHALLAMVTLGDDVYIGPNVVFADDPHPAGCPRYRECLGGATVGELARIGGGSTILPGVVIGRNTLIGAGSVVVHDVEEGTVVAGSPARVVKRIDDLECYPKFYERPYVWEPYTRAGKGTRP